MADVRWIKITVDMFDNRKIKHLRRLPNGDSIVLIWVMLLTLAGRCNAGGIVFLTENIPYTPSMLADELGFDEATITLALKSFEALGMVSVTEDSFLRVDGWEKHQNIEGMEKIKESKRLAQAKWRAKKKELAEPCSTVDSTVEGGSISVDDADKDIEENKELEYKSTTPKPPTPTRQKHGTYGWVRLAEEEYARLVADFGEAETLRCINYVDESAQSTGNKNKWRDWNLVIRKCHRDGWGLSKSTNTRGGTPLPTYGGAEQWSL